MKKALKKFYVVLTSVLIYVLHLPFVVAKSATGNGRIVLNPGDSVKQISSGSTYFVPKIRTVYDSLHLELKGLSQQAFEFARKGFDKLMDQGRLLNDSIISIIDFSQPSDKKRLYILDMKNYKVLHNTLVAHGRNSGHEMANSFSNTHESFKSSPGFFLTESTYEGKNGYSLRLIGLEKGINDNAYERTIVMHGADYVSNERAANGGFVGRSWGCPAVPAREAIPIINKIKDGSCLFIYTPDTHYLSKSDMLN